MTVYRTIAFDQSTMAYHGGDPGWIRHANTGNLSRPSLEPDLSGATLVRPIRLGRFGRRLPRVRHAPNVLGDLPLVHPVGTDRFGNRLQLTSHAPNVLGLGIDPSIVADIAQGVEAAAAVGATAYALDEQHKATKAAKAQASADKAAADAATAQAAQAAAAPAPAGKKSNILVYAVGGLAAVAVLMLLMRRRSAPTTPAQV